LGEAPFLVVGQLDAVVVAIADLDEPPPARGIVDGSEDAEGAFVRVEDEALALASKGPAPRTDVLAADLDLGEVDRAPLLGPHPQRATGDIDLPAPRTGPPEAEAHVTMRRRGAVGAREDERQRVGQIEVDDGQRVNTPGDHVDRVVADAVPV